MLRNIQVTQEKAGKEENQADGKQIIKWESLVQINQ